MNPLRPRPLAGLAVAGLLLAAGCGGKSDSSGTAATAAPTTAAPTTTVDPAQIKSEVTAVFTSFFKGFAGDAAKLEDGATMQGAIDSLKTNTLASGVTTPVKDVKPLDAAACEAAAVPSPCAEVSFDLVLNGDPVVPNQTGYAVYQAGQWKVSKATLCSLASLSGTTPAGC